jgi:hypothetical protein
MNLGKHFILFIQAVSMWAAFWLAGLPSYYQQYSIISLAVASIFLTVAISLAALYLLKRVKPEARLSVAVRLCFYYTIPFAALDAWYCGIYLGHGTSLLHNALVHLHSNCIAAGQRRR